MRANTSANEIAVLITMIEEQDDPRESFALLQQRIARYQEDGDEVPEELVRVHQALQVDLILESQGR